MVGLAVKKDPDDASRCICDVKFATFNRNPSVNRMQATASAANMVMRKTEKPPYASDSTRKD